MSAWTSTGLSGGQADLLMGVGGAEGASAPPLQGSLGSPPTPSPSLAGRGTAGFTLIEMLVALAIFSLAALALLRLSGATATNSARLQEQGIAQIVAENLAVETLTDPGPPPIGAQTGQAVNAGRRWTWTRTTARSPEARIVQIEIAVASLDGGPGRSRLTLFRRATP